MDEKVDHMTTIIKYVWLHWFYYLIGFIILLNV